MPFSKLCLPITVCLFFAFILETVFAKALNESDLQLVQLLQRTFLKSDETLVLSNVIFRHGDRYSEPAHFYPNDPNTNFSTFPYKFGELSKAGQNRMFHVGRQLHNRYSTFLGDTFYTDMVQSSTSNYSRTQMSLQSLHAGLFLTMKPMPILGFLWHPVPYNIIPTAKDKFLAVHKWCPPIFRNVTYPKPPPNVQALFDYVKLHTGLPQADYYEMWSLADYAKTMIETNTPIPEWHQKIYPEPLKSMTTKYLDLMRQQKARIGGGNLIKTIINDAVAKSKGQLLPQNRKLFLYSGHDIILHLLRAALNVWTPDEIAYGAYVLIELHKIENIYGFKVYFNNGERTPKLLTMPGCNQFCPLDQFIRLHRHIYEPAPTCN